VIAHAYEEKLETGAISLRDFFLIRLIRLYPVFLLSLALCSALLAWEVQSGGRSDIHGLAWMLGAVLVTALFLPFHASGNSDLFPLNPPYWSLFFELVANFTFALIRPALSNVVLAAVVVLLGLFLVGIAFSHGNLDLGASWPVNSVAAGLTRALFGMFMGVLLYRHRVFFEHRLGKGPSPWLAVFCIALVLSSPSVGRFDPVADILIVVFLFPLCVLVASRRSTTKLESLLNVLGSASYPIYVLHKPAGEILSHWFNGLDKSYAPWSGVALVLLLVAVSVWMERNYDIPVRKWLSRHTFKRSR